MSASITAAFKATGRSTAVPSNVTYRLGRLGAVHPFAGQWLDCGCADGGYAVGLLVRGTRRVVGIDLSVDELARARQNAHANGNATFGCAASEALPFASNSFDGVLLNEVLEHVADEKRTLAELYRVLRPGGSLALMSPNRLFPIEGHGMIVAGKEVLMPMPLLPWLPRQLGQRFMRARNYWPNELAQLVREAGFDVEVLSSVFPVFEIYPILPAGLIRVYRRVLPWLESQPVVRAFGLSTLIVAAKPAVNGGTPR